MRDLLGQVASGFLAVAIGYFVLLNTWYLVLLVLAAVDLIRFQRKAPFAGYDDLFASPLTPPVSIVVAAHNEERSIVEAVRALLGIRYPSFEVIVVDDDSDDDTFPLLQDSFDLTEVPRVVPELVPVEGEIRSVHVAAGGEPLTVLRKTGAGTKVDPRNAGIDVARYPLVCFVDADTLLDPDALLRVVKPFFDQPQRTVAAGGTVRAVNGSVVYRGRLVEAGVPQSWLGRVQVVEYLRAFMFGRSGWSRLDGLFVMPGMFGVFRRSVLIEIGGFRHGAPGDDSDLVPLIHRRLRERHADYRIAYVPEPVCWTEVPEKVRGLHDQRRRWGRAVAAMLWRQRRMVFNPRYGRIGLGVVPYFLVFEVLGPIVELGALVAAVAGLIFGVVDVPLVALFLLASIGYGFFLSIASLALEELTLRRNDRRARLGVDVVAALLENVGYRQREAWWRLRGLVDALVSRERPWSRGSRRGFETEASQAEGPELAVPPYAHRRRSRTGAGT